MQKKILALAVAAAVSAPAFADNNVTVYGKFDVSVDAINTGTAAAGTAGTTSTRVSSNTSKFGLKGNEDLGNGLSAIWQVESLVNVGNGGSAGTGIGGRNTFLGLSSASVGTLLAGRHDTPYNISTRAYDVFGDGIADNRNIMGGVAAGSAAGAFSSVGAASFDGRQDQVVAYISPKFGDVFTLAAGYVNLSPAAATAATAKNSAVSVAGMFGTAGFTGSVGYESHALNTVAAGATERATKVGLGYSNDQFALAGVYEQVRGSTTGGINAIDHNSYYVSGKFNATENDAIKLAYTHAGNLNNVANTGATQVSVGYDHNLSKRTTVYALYSKLTNKAAAGYAFATTSSVGGASTSAGVGASPSVFGLGVKHTF